MHTRSYKSHWYRFVNCTGLWDWIIPTYYHRKWLAS